MWTNCTLLRTQRHVAGGRSNRRRQGQTTHHGFRTVGARLCCLTGCYEKLSSSRMSYWISRRPSNAVRATGATARSGDRLTAGSVAVVASAGVWPGSTECHPGELRLTVSDDARRVHRRHRAHLPPVTTAIPPVSGQTTCCDRSSTPPNLILFGCVSPTKAGCVYGRCQSTALTDALRTRRQNNSSHLPSCKCR